MNQLSTWTSYEEMNEEISRQMGNIATGFICLGYLFKKAKETELFKEAGYETIYDYAQGEYNISRWQAGRFMEINDAYSADGNPTELNPKYIGYGSSKLTEMLGLPKEIREEIPADITVRGIRTIKAELSEKIEPGQSMSDVAQTLENTNVSAEKDLLKLFVISFFKNHKNEFKSYFNIAKSAIKDEKLTDRVVNDKLFNIIAPSKFKMERTEGYNTIIKETGIKIMPLAAGNKGGDYTLSEFLNRFNECYFITKDGSKAENPINDKDAWTFYYMEPFEDIIPVEVKIAKTIEKPKVAPVKQKAVKTKDEDDSDEEEDPEEDEDNIDEQIPGQVKISDYPGIVPEVVKDIEIQEDIKEDTEETPEEVEEPEEIILEEPDQEEESEIIQASIVDKSIQVSSWSMYKRNGKYILESNGTIFEHGECTSDVMCVLMPEIERAVLAGMKITVEIEDARNE